MLIVICKDSVIVNFRKKESANEDLWGPVHVLNSGNSQKKATQELISLLNTVTADEPLCIVGHGNDTECGGEGVNGDDWGWTADEMAQLLNTELTAKPGPILFEVCSDDPEKIKKMQVIGFGTEVQRAFGRLTPSKFLKYAWVYSYNTSIECEHTLPDPSKIDKSRELQASKL